MPPAVPLPIHADFLDADHYVDSLLEFVTGSETFRTLCGGVHILDFLTSEPDLYSTILPPAWRAWFGRHDVLDILHALLRQDVEAIVDAPPDLRHYIRDIRRFSLVRDYASRARPPTIARQISAGMKPKKIHEVQQFARYVDDLCSEMAGRGQAPTHLVDFGSGQNYLGRALASDPYRHHIVAVESKASNIEGARVMDANAMAKSMPRLMRDKKRWRQQQASGRSMVSPGLAVEDHTRVSQEELDRHREAAEHEIPPTDPRGFQGSITYVEHRLLDGDLSAVAAQVESAEPPRFMVVSLHSCGNLTHHGLRALIMNESVEAVAMVGCCYNLLTERLGPPTYKLPILRPDNARVKREELAFDPHGFPMSERVGGHEHAGGRGVRLNVTARMMAVQAPENWTPVESEVFFTRHYYRALLQRIFLDRGVISQESSGASASSSPRPRPAPTTVEPVIIGSLRKACYQSFRTYVRGAIEKMASESGLGRWIDERMRGLSDDEIDAYEARYGQRKKDMSVLWSLMGFSAMVAEAVVVSDRWCFLREQALVDRCWVETVFGYDQSPRNLVVVGIKKRRPPS